MTDQVSLPSRILDANGDPVSGARIFTFVAGTTTPLTTFTDETLETAHPNPIDVDGAGVPPQIFYDGSVSIRIRITEASGAAIYDYDPALTAGLLSQASEVGFSPVTDNTAKNVQDAIENNTLVANDTAKQLGNSILPETTGGAGNAYTVNLANPVTEYEIGLAFRIVANRGNTGVATMNVDNVGPLDLWKYDGLGVKGPLTFGDLITGGVFDVVYDGTRFVVTSATQGTETKHGLLKIATIEQIEAGTDTTAVLSVAGGRLLFDTQWIYEDPQETTSGTSFDTAGMPASTREIVGILENVSLSGSDNLLIQGIAGSPVTSGYGPALSIEETGGSTSSTTVTSTSGMPILTGAAARAATGEITLTRIASTTRWISRHRVHVGGNTISKGVALVDLEATLTGIRLTTDGSDTFDGGFWTVSYRK